MIGAGINRFETGIEGALPDGLQGDGGLSGAASLVDVSQEALSGKGICLDRNGFASEIIRHPISIDGLYPAGFKGDRGLAIVRHGCEGPRPVTGIGPCRTSDQDRKGYDDLDNQMRSAHGGIIE